MSLSLRDRVPSAERRVVAEDRTCIADRYAGFVVIDEAPA
jgi:hypothetical protein